MLHPLAIAIIARLFFQLPLVPGIFPILLPLIRVESAPHA